MNAAQKKTLRRILCAAAMFLVLLGFSKSGLQQFSGIPHTVLCCAYVVPYLIVGYDVLVKAAKNIRHSLIFDENFLMTIATFAAFFIGEYDEALAVMLFYQVGELFQSYAVGKSRQSIAELMSIAPEYANRLEEDGSLTETDPEEIEPGDLIVIRPGERVPLDGTVIEGSSYLDTAALTGEPVPRHVKTGEAVISGCVNKEGTLKVRVTKGYEDSTVARILELVESAGNRKARLENFITRFAKYYTPVVTLGAVLLMTVPPLFFGGAWMDWIKRACVFLIVSCPCALVISVPLGFFGGIGAASRIGVLVKGSNYLEAVADIKTLVFDKTGTLTKGTFAVTRVIPEEEQREVLFLAACAETFSNHPIAKSVCESYGETPDLSRLKEASEEAGHGMRVLLDGKEVLAGSARMMEKYGVRTADGSSFVPEVTDQEAGTVVYVAHDGVYRGAVVIADALREDAERAVREIKKAGIRTVMLTGDRRAAAEEVAKETGIDEVYAELLPGDKVKILEELMGASAGAADRNRGRVAFVGDGVNDAPVLMRADVGIAMGGIGSDAAIEAADLVLMDDSILKIARVAGIAKKTAGIVRQNVVFSIGVKVLVLLLGAAGVASMWAAVFADVGVCVIAVLNSMRMLGYKG